MKGDRLICATAVFACLLLTNLQAPGALGEMSWSLEVRLDDHTDWANSAVFSPDGTMLATVANDKNLFVYRTDTWEMIRNFQLTGTYGAAEWSPDGDTLCVGTGAGIIEVYDVGTWTRTHAIQAHGVTSMRIQFTTNGETLVSASWDKMIRFWDTRTWTEKPGAIANAYGLYELSLTPDGRLVAADDWDAETVNVWDAASGTRVASLSGLGYRPNNIDFSPDGTRLAAVSEAGKLIVWDVASWTETANIDIGDEGRGCAWHPDSTYLAICLRESGVKVLDPVSWNVEATLTGHTDIYQMCRWSADGTHIADVSNDHTVNVYEIEENSLPIAEAGDDQNTFIGEILTFDGSDSYDPDGEVLSFEWAFADGSEDGTGTTVTHAFSSEGTYTVTLTVTDDDGATDSDTCVVTILDNPPVAEAGEDLLLIVGEVGDFDGSGSSDADGSIATYDWDFGDGSEHGTGVSASHSFASAGTYTVTLTVTDDDGGTATDTLSVEVITASTAIGRLISAVEAMNLGNGLDNSLDSKLEAFVNEVEAQCGKAITNDQADLLVAWAEWIIENV